MSQKPESVAYACAVCGKSVLMLHGDPQRQCTHNTAAIVASMKATAYGEAKVK